MSEKQVIERRLRLLTDRLIELESRPAQPEFDEGLGNTVVVFDVEYVDHRRYTYAAIRSGERWYVTQSRNSLPPMTWEQLMDWLDDEQAGRKLASPIWVVSGYEALA